MDTSEGKTDPIYAPHSYHTKVPFKAIMRAILYYTQPGDLVLDGFAGSGMTGVAAQMCGQPPADFRHELEQEWQAADRPPLQWGLRRAILNDLSPAATFITANYNLPFDVNAFEREARRILKELKQELGWMYETLHTDSRTQGEINYTVWSEVFSCPECSQKVIFLDEALETSTKRVRDNFPCPNCGVELTKNNLQRLFETFIDSTTDKYWQRIRLIPVLINYSLSKNRHEKKPEKEDIHLLKKITELPLPDSVPTNEFPIDQMSHGSRLAPKGFTRINHLYLPRQAQALGNLWAKATTVEDVRIRQMLLFFVEQAIWGMSVLNRYGPTHFSQVNRQLTGVYYVSSQISEVSPWYNLDGKLKRLVKAFQQYNASHNTAAITTGTVAHLSLPDQVSEYDRQRLAAQEVLQLPLIVTDEASAIQWLKQQLTQKPQTFQEIHPQFMKEIGGWQKHEKTLELTELLEQNFLVYNGQGIIPEQLWSWLQQNPANREEMAGQTRETASEALRRRAKDRWYVPDPARAGDLEKLREKALLKEFAEYRQTEQRRLRLFRLEAVRAGFKKAWQEQDYATIIQVAEKIPANILQEDPKLLMWYDQATTRLEM